MKENEFITETYVTFEQAKALEELGFDGWKWDCDYWYYYTYNNHDKPIFARCEQVDSYDVEKYWYAPTLAHAQKWLRDIKGIHLWIESEPNEYDKSIIYAIYILDNNKQQYPENYNGIESRNTYEEAFLVGIDAAIKILKNG